VLTVAQDAPPEAIDFAKKHLFAEGDEDVRPLPVGGPRLSLEKVIEALHDSEINVGLQTFYDCGLQVWIGDEMNGIRAKGSANRGTDKAWPDDGAVALWLHEAALSLYPDSGYAKRYGERPDALTIEQR
jgi:hypothetical protein